jgi:hypothetical protein
MIRKLFCFGLLAAAALSAISGPAVAAAAEKTHQVRIAFVGDSMADGLWGAMFRRVGKDKCLAQRIALLRRARNGTGLARMDQFNWVEQIRTIAKNNSVDLFVGSFGINDRQGIVEPAKKRIEFGTPEFDDRYKAIVTDAVRAALAEGSSMLIVGLPVILDSAANADAAGKNRIYEAALQEMDSDRAAYVPPWQSTSGGDQFKPYLPNAAGTIVQVRAQDGVHFTPEGYDMVMNALYPAIDAALRRRGEDLATECAYEAKTK